MKIEFHIDENWRKRLESAGLGTLDSLLAFDGSECLSLHRRGATFRHTLDTGEVIYIKRDHFTFKKEMFKDFFHLRWPAQKTVKERLAFNAVNAAGFTAPKVVAWGTTTRLGLPDKAAFVMLGLAGKNLDAYLKDEEDEGRCRQAISAAEEVLSRLQNMGFYWPDHKPEHFIVQPDGNIAIIDLERMVKLSKPVSRQVSEKQLARFRRLLPKLP